MFFNVSFKCFSTKVASQAWKILLFIYCLSIAILQNTDLIKMRLGVLNGMRMAPLMVNFLHYTCGGGQRDRGGTGRLSSTPRQVGGQGPQ